MTAPSPARPRNQATEPGAYRELAPAYDRLIGRPFFAGLRVGFEQIVGRYGIRFRSAADLGCGTGLFACYLRRRWRVPVFGVDRSDAMLRKARSQCPGSGVRWLHQDLRNLRLPRRVDLATANFDTLNHLVTDADLRRALGRISANLEPGGHFVFDLITPGVRTAMKPRCRSTAGGGTLCQRVMPKGRRGLFTTTVVHNGPTGRGRVRQTERAYRPEHMRQLLRESGFRVRAVLDAETLRKPVGPAPRVLIVAQRNRSG